MFYVYLHRRADTGSVFYVGKGRGRRAWALKGRSDWWRAIIAKHGYTVEVVAEYASEAHAFEYERCAIACYRGAGFELCNLTDGGEGISGLKRDARLKAAVSAAQRGRPRTPEFRDRMAEIIRKHWAGLTKDVRSARLAPAHAASRRATA